MNESHSSSNTAATEAHTHGRRSIIFNFVYLSIGHLFYKATALLVLVLLARYLGGSLFGQLVVGLAAAQLAEAIGDVGISQALVREGAGRPLSFPRDLMAVLPVKLALAVLSVAIAMLFVLATGASPELTEVTFYLALAQALSSLTLFARSVFQRAEQMEYEALSVALEGWIRLGAVLFAITGGFGLLGVAKMLSIASLVVLLATAAVATHRFLWPISLVWAPGRATQLFAMGLPIAFTWLAVGADQRIDTLVVARFWSEETAGAFGAATRLVEPTLIIPTVLAAALFPVAVRHDRLGLPTFALIVTATQKALLVMGVPLSIGIWLTAPVAVTVIFGPDFGAVVEPLRILAPSVLLLFARVGLTQILVAADQSRDALLSQVVGVLVNLSLALVLIPSGGASGAAIALLGGQCAAVGAGFYFLRDQLGRAATIELGRPVLVGVPAALIGAALAPISLEVALIGSACGFLAAMKLIPIFASQEIGYIRSEFPPLAAVLALSSARPK